MKRFIPLFAFVFISIVVANSQSVIYEQNFENLPISNIVNTGDMILTTGPSPCGKASRGNTSDFNSSNVDFNNSQNSSNFLAVNPESPCGGYYDATLYSDTFNLTGYDTVRYSCRYFKSSTLGWGPTLLSIQLVTATDTFTMDSTFLFTDNWNTVNIILPTSMYSSQVSMTVNMGGGEGVGLDDILITGVMTPTTSIESEALFDTKLYPVPATSSITIESEGTINTVSIINIEGKTLMHKSVFATNRVEVDVQGLSAGTYFIKLVTDQGKEINRKIIKQ